MRHKHSENIDLVKEIFGDDVICYKNVRTETEITYFIDSTTKKCKCPKCGFESNKLHGSTGSKNATRLMIRPEENKLTTCVINKNIFKCENEECNTKYFTENVRTTKKYQRMDNYLRVAILTESMFLSCNRASQILKKLGIKISRESIRKMISNVEFVDNPNVTRVGIDDVAIRKGQTYATIIYDLDDYSIVGFIEGRDKESLLNWLKNHKNIKFVTRDRASAYAKAIDEALPDCVQVADKFHIFQNLVEKFEDILKSELPQNIYIKDGEIIEKTDVEYELVPNVDPNSKKLDKYNYDNSTPLDENGKEIIYNNETQPFDQNRKEREKERIEKRVELSNKILELYTNSQLPKRKRISYISKELGMIRTSVYYYLKMAKNNSANSDRKKIETETKEYKNIIFKMLKDNINPSEIFSYVLRCGYKGTFYALSNTIYNFSCNNFNKKMSRDAMMHKGLPNTIKVISRSDIIRAITVKDQKKIDNIEAIKYLDVIKKKYPVTDEIEKIYNEFYSILMGDEPDKLDEFISTYSKDEDNPEKNKDYLKPIYSFVNKIKEDIAPVKNAISYKNSTAAKTEGSNGLFKFIKRIVFGRCNFVNLKKRCFLIFSMRKADFDIIKMVV